jgi:hypothetical protein
MIRYGLFENLRHAIARFPFSVVKMAILGMIISVVRLGMRGIWCYYLTVFFEYEKARACGAMG